MPRLTCLGLVLASLVGGAPAHAEPEYLVEDITGWTSAQLAGLPRFHRWMPGSPAGASASFSFEARRGDLTAGAVASTYGSVGAVVHDGAQLLAWPLGQYYWSNTYWDGTDWHFQNGRVEIARALDVNSAGAVVGTSTIAGTGDSAAGYVTHAVMFSATDPTMTDLTPAADRAEATGLNESGAICGWLQTGAGQRMFRLSGGSLTEIGTLGGWANRAVGINAAGRIAGVASVSLSYTGFRAVVSESGTDIADLGLPPTGPSTDAAAYDLNDGSLVVGASWDRDQSYEHFATLWERQPNGAWEAYDLNEVLADNPADALLENAIAVDNAGRIIATGRPDGSDAFGSHRYLLTPVGLPSCVPDLDGNGVLNVDDIDAFATAFLAGDLLADIDASGVLNVDDIDAFVTAFLGGCG